MQPERRFPVKSYTNTGTCRFSVFYIEVDNPLSFFLYPLSFILYSLFFIARWIGRTTTVLVGSPPGFTAKPLVTRGKGSNITVRQVETHWKKSRRLSADTSLFDRSRTESCRRDSAVPGARLKIFVPPPNRFIFILFLNISRDGITKSFRRTPSETVRAYTRGTVRKVPENRRITHVRQRYYFTAKYE